MTTRSISLRESMPRMFSRLSMRSLTSMPGNSWAKRTSSMGTKYLAVLTTARSMRPFFMPTCSAMLASRSLSSADGGNGMGEEFVAGVGELDVAPDRLDQRQAEGFLKLADLHRNRRLRDEQALRSLGNRFLARDLDEGLQLLEGVITHGNYFNQIKLMIILANVI